MNNEITLHDLLSLHPVLLSDEEIYRIETESSVFFLSIFVNSEYGCEYTLYNEEYDEVEGGVIDDAYTEDETEVAQIILDLLDEMSVCAISLSKLSHEEDDENNVDAFQERANERWEKKVATLKSVLHSV